MRSYDICLFLNFSLSIIFSRSFCVVTKGKISLFVLNSILLNMYTTFYFFIDGHVLLLVSNAFPKQREVFKWRAIQKVCHFVSSTNIHILLDIMLVEAGNLVMLYENKNRKVERKEKY